MTYQAAAIKLWQMLDDIDTYSDMAKADDKLYRSLVERKQRERFGVFKSDGYSLFDMDGNVVDYHEGSDWVHEPTLAQGSDGMVNAVDFSNGTDPDLKD